MSHFHQLFNEIAAITDREYLLYPAGILGLFHLGEKGVPGLHLIDATPEEVLRFVYQA
jgi:hypothetical protein